MTQEPLQRTCRRCGVSKTPTDFRTNWSHARYPDGYLEPTCRACHQATETKRQQTTTGGAACWMLRAARQRAKKSGVPCTLSRAWLLERLAPGRCEVSGLPLDFSETAKTRRPFGPSLDQEKPGHGYTPENTRVVCSIFNYAKNAWTDADVRTLAEALCRR